MTRSFSFLVTHTKKAVYLKYKFAPALESPFLQAAMAPSSGKWYLETMVWALGMLVAVELATVSQLCHCTEPEYIFLKIVNRP